MFRVSFIQPVKNINAQACTPSCSATSTRSQSCKPASALDKGGGRGGSRLFCAALQGFRPHFGLRPIFRLPRQKDKWRA